MTAKEECGNCKHWRSDNLNLGRCVKNAPSPVRSRNEDDESHFVSWPMTEFDDDCGEFKASGEAKRDGSRLNNSHASTANPQANADQSGDSDSQFIKRSFNSALDNHTTIRPEVLARAIIVVLDQMDEVDRELNRLAGREYT